MRSREINAAIKAFEKAEQKLAEIEKKYPVKFKKEIEDIGRTVIDKWYDSYDSRSIYEPYGSLYYAFKVDVKNGIGAVKFSPKFIQHIPHHQKSTIIYNNAFLEGYHGGSWGDGVPKVGVPYWRTPYPFYPAWGDPAIQTFSPYEEMHNRMQKKIKEIEDEYNNEMSNISKKLTPHIRKMKGV